MSNPTRLTVAVAALAVALVGVTGLPAAPAEAKVTKHFTPQYTRWLGPGIKYQKGIVKTNWYRRQSVRVVTVDPSHPQAMVRSLLSNRRVTGRQKVTATGRMYTRPGFKVVAATNGDMSKRGRSDIYAAPSGIHIAGSELMVAQPCANPAIAIDADGDVRAGDVRVRTQVWLKDKPRASRWVHRVNAPRVSKQTVLYTTRVNGVKGRTPTPASGGREVVLRMSDPQHKLRINDRQAMTVVKVRNGGRTRIYKGRAVLSTASKTKSTTWVYDLRVGDKLEIETDFVGNKPACGAQNHLTAWEDVTEIQTGTHFSVRWGKNAAWMSKGEYVAAVHPKTGLGITADGRVLMVTVDGRQGRYSYGVSMSEMAQIMMKLGAKNAINLDGGGSTSMSRWKNGALRLDNRPSDGRERPMTQTFAAIRLPAPDPA